MLQLADIKDLTVEHTSGSQRSAYNRRDDRRLRPAFRGGVYTVARHSVIGKVITAFSQELENVFYQFKDRK